MTAHRLQNFPFLWALGEKLFLLFSTFGDETTPSCSSKDSLATPLA